MIVRRHRDRVRPLTGRRVLAWVVGFFVMVILVNAAFVYFALKSWPGLTSNDPYREGLAYNRTLAAARTQAERGWRSDVGYATSRFVVRIVGADGQGIEGLSVELRIGRGVGPENELVFPLTEAVPGTYTSVGRPPMAGHWKATVVATRAAEEVYRMEHSLMVGS